MPIEFFDTSIFELGLDDWRNLAPFLGLCVGIAVMVVVASFRASDKVLRLFSFGFLAVTSFLFFSSALDQGRFFLGSSMELGPMERIVGGCICLFAALCSLYMRSPDYQRHSEWGALLLLCVLGMCLLPTARNWVAFFVYLEALSIPAYLLSALYSNREKSLEASMKYLMMGAFVSCFFLLGISLFFAVSGSFQFEAVSASMSSVTSSQQFLCFTAATLVFSALAFKVSLFPFHFWAADVYQGAPAPVASFLAGATKLSVFSSLILSFSECGLWDIPGVSMYVKILGIVSVVFGAVMALSQTRLRRMLAYSGVVNAGFIALVLPEGLSVLPNVIGFLSVYALSILICFAVHEIALVNLGRGVDDDLEISSFVELKSKVSRFYLVLLGFALLSLAGIPPLPGFFTKYVLLSVLAKNSAFLLLGIALVGTFLGLGFYLRSLVPLALYPQIDSKKTVSTFSIAGAHWTAIAATLLSVLVIVCFTYLQGLISSAELMAR